ncbi:hypothetical protein [Sphingopyxis sp.]|uniref:hypothetical protein n=1 Tax=Sphingopyxis sp. TaxID=1908224 RepID=UPI0035B47216
MDRKRTCVAAACKGAAKELFSVRELAGGGLLLILGNASFLMEFEGRRHRVVEQRYTLHSGQAGETRITHSLRIGDGRIVTIATFTSEAEDAGIWPIFSRLVPDLRLHRFDLRSGAANHVVRIADYDAGSARLCYSVVARRSRKDPPPGSPIWFTTLSFRDFDLMILSRVIDGASTGEGAIIHHSARSRTADAGGWEDEAQLADIMESWLDQLVRTHRSAAPLRSNAGR